MYGKPYRGFESLSLRHTVLAAEKDAGVPVSNRAQSPPIRGFLLLNHTGENRLCIAPLPKSLSFSLTGGLAVRFRRFRWRMKCDQRRSLLVDKLDFPGKSSPSVQSNNRCHRGHPQADYLNARLLSVIVAKRNKKCLCEELDPGVLRRVVESRGLAQKLLLSIEPKSDYMFPTGIRKNARVDYPVPVKPC